MEEIHRIGMNQGYTSELKIEQKEVLIQIKRREEQEEQLWKKKSRNGWIKQRNRTTNFFPRESIQHRNTNKIIRIKKKGGRFLETHKDINL